MEEWDDSLGEVQKLWDKTFIFADRIAFEDLSEELRTSILKLASRKSMLSLVRGWWHFRDEANRQGQHPAQEFAEIMVSMDAANENLNAYQRRQKSNLNPTL